MKPENATMHGRPWVQSGNEFRQLASQAELVPSLPKAVYAAKFDMRINEFYLERIDEQFVFNAKIYGLEDKFINHVIKTYENTVQNMGILLNGVKGTGKTVCAKIIANEMNLPVILCDTPVEELTTFIAQFNVPAIFFFDEFEKNFKNKTEILLSAMDGAYNTHTRKIFILTTNALYINENFLSRPSRIRYKKSFGNLPESVIKMYCEENLNDKSRYEEIAAFIDTLAISTIDILKSIVEEINIHKCSIEEFKHFFNVTTAPYSYDVTLVEATNLYTLDKFKEDVDMYLSNFGFQGSDEIDEGLIEEDDSEKHTKKSINNLLRGNNVRGYFQTAKVSSNTPVMGIKEGESFSYGTVIKPMDKDGILVLENTHGYGKPYIFIKVANIDTRPSLYTTQVPSILF